jgi:tripartite-type tricarboxylate transporter receptor subunit TctC
MNRVRERIALAACTLLWAGGLGAQTYPAKAVRIVIPFAPGGGSDIVGRILAQKLTELWGQQVVIDNRPGGGGNIGAVVVARAPADGYTLFFANANHTINPSLYKSLQYDADKDFAPTSLVAIVTNVLAVHPSVPARNVRELVALAKSRPGELNFASPGSGTSSHLAGELFRTMAGIQVVHIPYKGAAPAVTDLLGGQVSFTITSVLSVMPHVKAGKLRALGVTTAKRASALPELPTIAESGLPGFEVSNWYGILAPAGTARPAIDRIAADLARTIQVRDIAEKFSAQGAEPTSNTPEQFATYIRSEITKWSRVVQASGARAE